MVAAGFASPIMSATYVVGVDISESRLNFSKQIQAIDEIVISGEQARTRLHELGSGEG